MPKKVLIINGPNINMLHKRNKEVYGDVSLEKVKKQCLMVAKELGIVVDFKNSNSEGNIINFIQAAVDKFDGIIINPAAYTHTSIAIRDALEIFQNPKVEVHISNIYKREEFRHRSLTAPVVDSVICGLGTDGYTIALLAINGLLKRKN